MTVLVRDRVSQICFGFEVMMRFVRGAELQFQGPIEVDGEMFDTENRTRELCAGRILSLLARDDVEVSHDGPVLTIRHGEASTIRVPPDGYEAWQVTLADKSGLLCDADGELVRFKSRS